MQRPLRVLAASVLLAMLFLAVLVPPPATAGSAETPEVTDAANDQELTPNGVDEDLAGCPPQTVGTTACQFTRIDILSGWIANDTADSVQFHILLSNVPGGTNSFNYAWEFHAKAGATDIVASAIGAQSTTPNAIGTLTPGGAATAVAVFGNEIALTVPKSAFGAATSLTDLYIHTKAHPANQALLVGQDRGPDGDAFGTSYPLAGGNGTATPTDSDADGLNDTWEQSNFGGLNETATGDSDADGCDNKCEFTHGSDPAKKDTDGDGYSDGDEVKANTNPTDPASHPTTGGTSSSTSGPPGSNSSTSGAPTSSTTSGDGSGGSGSGGDRTMGDRIQAALDTFYLPIAAGGAIVVMLFALIARGTRWGL